MLQLVSKNLIDDRAINTRVKDKSKDISIFKKIENLRLAINTATSIGCNTINQDPTFIMEKNPTMCLGLVWQIVRIGLLIKISLNDNPYLMQLAHEGETKEDLLKLSHEELLLRWVNYQLENNENYDGEPIKNFSSDIKNSVAYQYLLEEIQPQGRGIIAHPQDHSDLLDRAEETLKLAEKLDPEANHFVEPKDIVNGNPRLNLAFVANLYNLYPNLKPMEASEEDEILETREEKTYRNWINSLGIKPQINYLYTDLCHGVPLLKLEDTIKPGIINWKKVNMPPYKTFGGFMKKTENCSYAVETAPSLNVRVIGCRGHDIAEGSRILTLGLVWQLMRAYTISLLQQLSEDPEKTLSDKEIVQWYNEMTDSNIKTFKDHSIQNSLGFYKILKKIDENLEIDEIREVESYDEKVDNARLIISVARKLGAVVYTLPEDIVENNKNDKMVLCLVVCLMVLQKKKQTGEL